MHQFNIGTGGNTNPSNNIRHGRCYANTRTDSPNSHTNGSADICAIKNNYISG